MTLFLGKTTISASLRNRPESHPIPAGLRALAAQVGQSPVESTQSALKPGDLQLTVIETHDSRFLLLARSCDRNETRLFEDLEALCCAIEDLKSRNAPTICERPALVGASRAITDVALKIDLLSRVDSNVLVTGDTGTGKDLVARLIHLGSRRAAGDWVAVNCAALPDSLIESEMFGHDKGAFTGAHSRQKGKIEQAAGGTLFLDEIGEMSLTAQAKLLRVLETREVQPLGAARPRRVDFRLIAATNQNLEEMVREKRFRTDLYYRLSVAEVHLPALEERPEDIPALIDSIVAEMNQRFGRSIRRVDPRSLDWMLEYSWPGNVRELRCAIESAFIYQSAASTTLEVPARSDTIKGSVETAKPSEKDQLLETLTQTSWNKSETARHMNWSRMTLYRKLRKYGLDDLASTETDRKDSASETTAASRASVE